MKEGRKGERERKGLRVIYHCLVSAGLPSSLQASAKWNRKDKVWAHRQKKKKKEGKEEKTPTRPQGTQSRTLMTVTRGGIRRTLL